MRAAEDVVAQLVGTSSRAGAAGASARAADVLDVPQARLDDVKKATAVRLTQAMVELVREAAAASE